MTDESDQGYQYLQQLISIVLKHIIPALLYVLHNDGPNQSPTYKGIPRDPKLLHIYLSTPRSIKIISKLRSHKLIKRSHYILLFPQGCDETDSQRFTPYLIHMMIKNFTTIKPINGWKYPGVLSDDTSVAAYTVKANDFRNFVYHYNGPMTTSEFESKFTDAENILKGLRYNGDINSVKVPNLDDQFMTRLENIMERKQVNKVKGENDRLKNVEKEDELTASKSQYELCRVYNLCN